MLLWGEVLISDTFCYKVQRQTGLTVNEWLVWKDYALGNLQELDRFSYADW